MKEGELEVSTNFTSLSENEGGEKYDLLYLFSNVPIP